MKNTLKIAFIFILIASILSCRQKKLKTFYEPDFGSLEQINPAPEWFMDAKFGIYFHWGVYSVPAYANEWYPRNMYRPGSPENLHHIETYGTTVDWPYDKFITGAKDREGNFVQFAPVLKKDGGNFDPAEWARLFADAGARFAGPVAEHHDGFSMWASKVNPWNAKDRGPGMDLVGMLTDEIRKQGLKIILSMHHAYNITGYFEDVPPATDPDLQILYGQLGKEKNEALWLAKHKEIIDGYRPDILWQDFNLHVISEPVLLEFLSYYYNRATEWEKEVVATYKDGLNTGCAVLDFERGGPTDIMENYWLTDDAISSSSWCYTEGIGYYSLKQVFHGFLDRVSKNGNLLLNISPKADGSIPKEQKDVLLGMGQWLKRYGEAVYNTRTWVKYGEGPTKMGAAHGVFTAPKEGTSLDVRYTQSKDNSTLYAILLGWEEGQEEVILESLSSDRIDLRNLRDVELMNGSAGNCLSLEYAQDENGLIIRLPEKKLDELAYVLKLIFDGNIPALDNYAEIDPSPYYMLSPGVDQGIYLAADGTLSSGTKNPAQQWKIQKISAGIYKILNRENERMALTGKKGIIMLEDYKGSNEQHWYISHSFNELLRIVNIKDDRTVLSVTDGKLVLGNKHGIITDWHLKEVCGMEQFAFKKHTIPGIIEAEDFDTGCPGDAWYDRDEQNAGGQYRPDEGIDIEVCGAGGYNIGWVRSGEWMAYTLNVEKTGIYKARIFAATISASEKLHIEFDGEDKTGLLSLPDTGGYQNWQALETSMHIEKGIHVMKVVMDEAESGLNLDRIEFLEIL